MKSAAEMKALAQLADTTQVRDGILRIIEHEAAEGKLYYVSQSLKISDENIKWLTSLGYQVQQGIIGNRISWA